MSAVAKKPRKARTRKAQEQDPQASNTNQPTVQETRRTTAARPQGASPKLDSIKQVQNIGVRPQSENELFSRNGRPGLDNIGPFAIANRVISQAISSHAAQSQPPRSILRNKQQPAISQANQLSMPSPIDLTKDSPSAVHAGYSRSQTSTASPMMPVTPLQMGGPMPGATDIRVYDQGSSQDFARGSRLHERDYTSLSYTEDLSDALVPKSIFESSAPRTTTQNFITTGDNYYFNTSPQLPRSANISHGVTEAGRADESKKRTYDAAFNWNQAQANAAQISNMSYSPHQVQAAIAGQGRAFTLSDLVQGPKAPFPHLANCSTAEVYAKYQIANKNWQEFRVLTQGPGGRLPPLVKLKDGGLSTPRIHARIEEISRTSLPFMVELDGQWMDMLQMPTETSMLLPLHWPYKSVEEMRENDAFLTHFLDSPS